MLRKKIITSIACFALISSVFVGCNNNNGTSGASETEKTENKADNKDENKNKPDKTDKVEQNADNTSSNIEITYYTYDINSEELKENKKKVKELSVKNIVDELVSQKVLQEGTKVNKAKVEYIDDVKTLTVDMNDKFINFDLGSSAETLILQAFTNSLIKSFNVNQLKLTVDGQNYSSGHIVIDDGQFLKFK